jgi:hypothetical protein
MIQHVWSVLCSRSSTDRETNNLSLFEIIEQLNVLGPLPDLGAKVAIPVQLEIVSLWSRSQSGEAEESRGRLTLLSPSGLEAFTREFVVNLVEHDRMRTQLRLMGLPLFGTGRYTFTVEIQRANEQWEVVARIPLQLESIAQPRPQGVALGST